MSGAGRGTPRISANFSADPLIENIVPGTGQTNSIQSLGNGKWCYSVTVSNNLQVLTANFANYVDGGGNSSVPIPAGATRGAVAIQYIPGAIGSQLEMKIRYPAYINPEVFSLPGTLVFPAAGDDQGGEVPIAVPVYQTQVAATADPIAFAFPFCVPAGCPQSVGFQVREIGTIGGTFGIVTTLTVDNLGC